MEYAYSEGTLISNDIDACEEVARAEVQGGMTPIPSILPIRRTAAVASRASRTPATYTNDTVPRQIHYSQHQRPHNYTVSRGRNAMGRMRYFQPATYRS